MTSQTPGPLYVVKWKHCKPRDTGEYLRHRKSRGHELSRVPLAEALRFDSRESAITWCKEFVRGETGNWRDYAVVVSELVAAGGGG